MTEIFLIANQWENNAVVNDKVDDILLITVITFMAVMFYSFWIIHKNKNEEGQLKGAVILGKAVSLYVTIVIGLIEVGYLAFIIILFTHFVLYKAWLVSCKELAEYLGIEIDPFEATKKYKYNWKKHWGISIGITIVLILIVQFVYGGEYSFF